MAFVDNMRHESTERGKAKPDHAGKLLPLCKRFGAYVQEGVWGQTGCWGGGVFCTSRDVNVVRGRGLHYVVYVVLFIQDEKTGSV